jgi:hypothetical protein
MGKIDKVILVGGANGLSKRRSPNAEHPISNSENCRQIDKVIKSVRLEE